MAKLKEKIKKIRKKEAGTGMGAPVENPVQEGTRKTDRRRIGVVFCIILLFLLVLGFRVGWWMIVQAEELADRSTSMNEVDTEIEAVRGTIYDSSGNVLAETITEYKLYVYSNSVYKSDSLTDEEKDENAATLAEITGLSKSKVIDKLSGDDNLVLIAEGLTQDEIAEAQEVFGDYVTVTTTTIRSYPNGNFASYLIGAVSSDGDGLLGLEAYYDDILSGTDGRTITYTDSIGNTLIGSGSALYSAEDGYSIVTTIDSVIQSYAEEAVATAMEDTGAESVTVLIMDPETGDILAQATSPSYDPNDPYVPDDEDEYEYFLTLSSSEQSSYLSEMWTNPAISSVYEPGSTFKLITAASALDSSTITLTDEFTCNLKFTVNDTIITCWADSAHGSQTIKEAVAHSCNPALAQVALKMGAETFYEYIKLFGFMQKTGIDLPGETSSITNDPDTMGNVVLATNGYGHGIAITPIQLLTAICALGNDGVLMQPKLVSKILDSDGNVVEEIEDTVVRQVVSAETAAQMCEIMEYYTESSGGNTAYIAGYHIGGKTGTAYIPEDGGYSSDTVASYVAMAPMDDPQVAILVMVTKPQTSSYGSTAAGPVVKELMSKILPYLGIEKDEDEDTSSTTQVTVPDVTGEDSEDATETLEAKGFEVVYLPEGTTGDFAVVDQYPKAGTKADKGSTVYLYSE